jgi:hypothetical protein
MKIRQKFGGRSVPTATALVLFCCTSIAMLFAQAPLLPAHPDSSDAKFPEANAYARGESLP